MAKRGTKAQKQEIVQIFYGINPRTGCVESVSLSRDNKLTKYGSDATITQVVAMPGRKVETEIVVVLGLTELFGVPPGMAEGA